jgi:hypothetical protein
MGRKSLIQLAKENKAKNSLSNKVVKEKVIPKTPTEERDAKAKENVEELLKDINLYPEQKEVKVVLDKNSKEWLENQISLLSDDNEKLRKEMGGLKEENEKLKNSNGDIAVMNKVIDFFNDFQNNYIPGVDVMGRPNMLIWPLAFMNRMVDFFPFLASGKKF